MTRCCAALPWAHWSCRSGWSSEASLLRRPWPESIATAATLRSSLRSRKSNGLEATRKELGLQTLAEILFEHASCGEALESPKHSDFRHSESGAYHASPDTEI